MIDLINELENNNIRVSLVDEDLELSFDANNIDPDLILKVKQNKYKLIEYLKKYSSVNKVNEIKPIPIDESYPVSNAQKRLWVLCQVGDNSLVYNMPNRINLGKGYDITELKNAIYSVIDRHEILRTVFKMNEHGELRQCVLSLNELNFEIDYKDYEHFENPETEIIKYIENDCFIPFNLEKGPLLRACILRLSDDNYVFYYNMHHIISDGWSMEVLSSDIMKYYQANIMEVAPDIKELRIQYKDYASWQLSKINGKDYNEHKNFWLNHLSGNLPLINLPSQKLRPLLKTHRGNSLGTFLTSETTQNLRSFAKEQGGSLFMTLLTIWKVLLSKYTSQNDIILGTPLAGRDHADLEDQIGFYVSTIALRNKIDVDDNFETFFKRVKESTLSSFTHQSYPFDKLVDDLNVIRDTSRSPIFDTIFELDNVGASISDSSNIGENLEKIEDYGYTTSQFDLAVSFKEIGELLSFQVNYNTDVYDKQMVEKLMLHFKQLTSALLKEPKKELIEINYLTNQEKKILLEKFNQTETVFENEATIISLFQKQLKLSPDAIALVCEDERLTYRELERKSNQVANYLKTEYNIKKGSAVGVMLDRNEWLIISILGVLKAGGVYVPIASELPESRKHYIIKDAGLKVMIINKGSMFKIDIEDVQMIMVDCDLELSSQSSSKLKVPVTTSDLAYVIYTSGSTGKPKGVMIEQSGIVNTILSQIELFKLKDNERSLQFASSSFDASISEIFITLLAGKTLYIVNEKIKKDPRLLESYIKENKIDIATLPPAYLELLDIKCLKELKVLITAGEVPSLTKISEFLQYGGTYFNAYGPTEVSICGSVHEISSLAELETNRIPIGKPIPNTQIYIVDEFNKLQPIRVAGEICISGKGIAKGYLNQKELTKNKFISHPFRTGEQLYKTGDLGKYLPDGTIEFLGRKDDQVKVRGYRIELGEIEFNLKKKKSIQEAIVLVNKNDKNNKELVAYFTASKEQNIADLHRFLSKYLPDYMLPSHYVQLDKIPLTVNGKIDKKSLLDNRIGNISTGVEYVPPSNDVEKQLVEIWNKVLKLEKIGVYDNFFHIGGDSIKGAKVIAEIQTLFHLKLDLNVLFQEPNIKSLAEIITNQHWNSSHFEKEDIKDKVVI
ncbi:non-ribosomal peptide synthetase [Aquimarina sp. M1]